MDTTVQPKVITFEIMPRRCGAPLTTGELRRRSAIEPVIGHTKAEAHPAAAILREPPVTLPMPSLPPSGTISDSPSPV
jgi:hypothetical protein